VAAGRCHLGKKQPLRYWEVCHPRTVAVKDSLLAESLGAVVTSFQNARRHVMTQTIAVASDPRPPSPRPSSLEASSPGFPPDVVRLLDVLVRIESRRQARLRALQAQEAS